jgi:hypothetical protein
MERPEARGVAFVVGNSQVEQIVWDDSFLQGNAIARAHGVAAAEEGSKQVELDLMACMGLATILDLALDQMGWSH